MESSMFAEVGTSGDQVKSLVAGASELPDATANEEESGPLAGPGKYPGIGCWGGIEEEGYHASPGISQSRLKLHRKAEAKAFAPFKETTALRLGSVIHCALLEPDEVELRYQPSELKQFNAAHKAYQAELEVAKAAGRTLVKKADLEDALRLRDRVLANSTVAALLAPGQLEIEQSFWWHDEETRLLCRGRADAIRQDWRCLIDIKSTEDASLDKFKWSVRDYGYYWQDPFYKDGIEATRGWRPESCFFIAVEKDEPNLAAVYEIEPSHVRLGHDEVHAQLRAFAECERTGIWRGYPEGIQLIPAGNIPL